MTGQQMEIATLRNPWRKSVQRPETSIKAESPKHKRAMALYFLAHFIGDTHQPLHAGYAACRGGNDIEVTFFGKKTNLHEVRTFGILPLHRRAGAHLWANLGIVPLSSLVDVAVWMLMSVADHGLAHSRWEQGRRRVRAEDRGPRARFVYIPVHRDQDRARRGYNRQEGRG